MAYPRWKIVTPGVPRHEIEAGPAAMIILPASARPARKYSDREILVGLWMFTFDRTRPIRETVATLDTEDSMVSFFRYQATLMDTPLPADDATAWHRIRVPYRIDDDHHEIDIHPAYGMEHAAYIVAEEIARLRQQMADGAVPGRKPIMDGIPLVITEATQAELPPE